MKEQVHGVVGLQSGQGHVTGARLEGHWVCHYALVANHSIQLAVVNVPVLAQVDVGHAVEGQTLQVPDEVGGYSRHVELLCDDACLNVMEL